MRSTVRPGAPEVRPETIHFPRLRQFSLVPPQVRRLILFLSFLTVSQGFYYILVSAHLPALGVPATAVGLILGTSGATFVLMAIPLGIISDRKGRKKVFLAGTIGLPLALLVYALTTDVVYLVLAAIVIGVAQGAFLTTWNAMIADQTPLETRDIAFSMSFVVNIVANGIGYAVPVLFPIIEAATGLGQDVIHRDAIFFFVAFAALSPITLFFHLRGVRETRHPRRGRLVRGPRTRLLLRFSALNSLIGLGAGFIIPLIPTWLFYKFSATDAISGPLLTVSNLSIGFAALWSAGLAKRYGPVKAIALTQSLSTVFMVSLAFVPNLVLAGGFYVARAALMMMASPISDSYLMSIIDPETRGIASAINSIVWRLPNSASTVVGGALLSVQQFEAPFLLAAAFYLTSISLFYRTFRRVRPVDAGPTPAAGAP